MTKLNISGYNDNAEAIEPASDGTYAHIGSQGGTEMMMQGLRSRIDPELLDKFNIICSRVRDENIDKNKKNILWNHDTWDDPESEHLAKESSRKRFSKLVFVSNYQQSTFNIGRGVPFGDGVVMQNAIVPIPHHEKPNADGIINLIYHTTPHRGLELLVPAFSAVAESIRNIHLDVYSSFTAYGWPARDAEYEELFEKCRQHPKITYHGFQPNSVVREALQKAHIYAYPNIWPETSCISVIEAMSAGCAVVCSNYGALPETCANFAAMYGLMENNNRHANLFANVLAGTINNFWDERNQKKLKFQKTFFDLYYNWDLRAAQWTSFLQALAKQS